MKSLLERDIEANTNIINLIGYYMFNGFADVNNDNESTFQQALSYMLINNENLKRY